MSAVSKDEYESEWRFEDKLLYFHNEHAHPAVVDRWLTTPQGKKDERESTELRKNKALAIQNTLTTLGKELGEHADAIERADHQLKVALGEGCTREELSGLRGAHPTVLRMALRHPLSSGLNRNPDIVAELLSEMLSAGHGPAGMSQDALLADRSRAPCLLHRFDLNLLTGSATGMDFPLSDVLYRHTYSTEVIASLTSCGHLTLEQGREVQDYFADRLANGPHPVSLAEYGGAKWWLPPALLEKLLQHTNSVDYADHIGDATGLLAQDVLDDHSYFLGNTLLLWSHRLNDRAFCETSTLLEEMLPRMFAAGISLSDFLLLTLPRTVKDDDYTNQLLSLLDSTELDASKKEQILIHVSLYGNPKRQGEFISLFATHGISIPPVVAINSWWCQENSSTIEMRAVANDVSHLMWRDACGAFADRFAALPADEVLLRWNFFLSLAPTFTSTYPDLMNVVSETFR